jgi:hypothetical protein
VRQTRRSGVIALYAMDAGRNTPQVADTEPDPLERDLLLAFAPLHKLAFGVATGAATGLLIAALTLINVIHPPDHRFPLLLLNEYFYGYSDTWAGIAIGAGWGVITGFVAGWFAAFCRNIAVAISIFTIRTRAELRQTRDFLDHI